MTRPGRVSEEEFRVAEEFRKVRGVERRVNFTFHKSFTEVSMTLTILVYFNYRVIDSFIIFVPLYMTLTTSNYCNSFKIVPTRSYLIGQQFSPLNLYIKLHV